MGRIRKVHPGSDGVVRVVSIKARKSETKRAVSQICLLQIQTIYFSIAVTCLSL